LISGALVLNAVALLISSGYLVGLVQGVRGGNSSQGEYLRQIGQTATLIGGALLIIIGVLLVLALPFLALSLLLLMAIPASLLVIVGLWYIVIFWVLVYTTLVPEAAAMSSKGPLHCIYTSVNLVRRNTVATLLLLGIGLLIGSGFGSVFRYLAEAGAFWGPPLACACSAYIGSGLAAARVVFYRERLARWGK
jgi:fatty acid desaturase